MVLCAQSDRFKGLERKTDPASSSRNNKKGLKDKINRLLGIVYTFCIAIGTKSKISISGGVDSDCHVVTLDRVGNFRAKHPNSDVERRRRGRIKLEKLFIILIIIFLYHFSVKWSVNRWVFRVK